MAMPSPVTLAKDDQWLVEQLRREAQSAEPIVVPPTLAKPSYGLVTTINAVKAEKAQKSPHSKRNADGTYVYPPHLRFHPSVMALRVTPAAANRALLIIDTLMKACEQRGLGVSVADRYMRVTHGAHEVQVRMSERVEQVVGSTKGMSNVDILFKRNIKYRSTNELTIAVIGPTGERKTTDKNNVAVEGQLHAVMRHIYRGLAERRVWSDHLDAKVAEATKRAEARHAEREVREAAEAEVERLADVQRKLQVDVVAEATTWQQSRTILAYIDHLAATVSEAGGQTTAELKEWIDQATAIAERLDPTNDRLMRAVPDDSSDSTITQRS